MIDVVADDEADIAGGARAVVGAGNRDRAGLAFAFRRDGPSLRFLPQALCTRVRVVCLAKRLVEPAAVVLAAGGAKGSEDFPVVARLEGADLGLALDEDRECRGLHAPDRRELKSARLGVERGHRAGAVDADEPVGFRAAHRGIREWPHRLVLAQRGETILDRVLRHRLQPQAPDRLARLRVLNDVAEDELAFPTCVARVDQLGDVLALHQPEQQLQASFGLFQRSQREPGWNHRKVSECPLTSFDFLLVGRADLEQVPDRRRQHVLVALEIVVVTRETAKRPGDVGGHGRFLGDDEALDHEGTVGVSGGP